jgi:hypothetical protein
MIKPALFLLLLLVFCGSALSAQDRTTIQQDTSISMLFNTFVELNKSRKVQSGWRIQIISTTDRQRMEGVKQAFQYRFPDVPTKWEHEAPYYKLRAGAFATKLQAVHLLHLIKQEFPSAYLTQDDSIVPSELLEVY